MRHLHLTVLATVAVALCAAPIAAADSRHNDHGHATISPAHGGGLTGDELLGEAVARSLRGSNRPFEGTCTTLARNVLQAHSGDDGTATCTATPHSRLFFTFAGWCTDIEDPIPRTRREHLACLIALAQEFPIQEINITVDNRDTINLVRRRFELWSPLTTFELPADNPLGLPAQTATASAHGYGAVIHSLRPGRHTVTVDIVFRDVSNRFITIYLDVVRGGG